MLKFQYLIAESTGVLSSARRLVILFFRMGINRAYGLHRFLHYSEMQEKVTQNYILQRRRLG